MAERTARLGLKRGAALIDRLRPQSSGVVILIYHRVGGGSSSSVDLDPGTFRQQMEWLAEHTSTLDMERTIQVLRGDTPMPERPPVHVTFDDGTSDFTEHALPALVDHGVPATYYVATHFIDAALPFPGDARPMSWPQVAEAHSTGLVDIGSHTHRHLLMDRLDRATAAVELDRSIELIGEHTGVPARHFAYPKAVPATGEVDALVRQRFASAAVGRSRANPPGRTDLHGLCRTPIQTSDGRDGFAAKVNGGGRTEDSLRRALNRARYRGKVD